MQLLFRSHARGRSDRSGQDVVRIFKNAFRCQGCIAFLVGALMTSCCHGFGEADHPGPGQTNFALGTVNSTGLTGKQNIIAQLPRGA